MKTRNASSSCIVLILAIFGLCRCNTAPRESSVPQIADTQIPHLWAEAALYITQHTPANSPTFASRAFGYFGLTMYESVVHGYNNKRSLAGQLNDLDALPLPDSNVTYIWPLVLNSGQAFIIRNIYLQASDESKSKIDSLENIIYKNVAARTKDTASLRQSVEYGRKLATAIYEWSETDGGHRGYLANFDPKYAMPGETGQWKAPFYGQTISRFPLHPHWGNNRTFLEANSQAKAPPFIKYEAAQKSSYYSQQNDVYTANKNLTQEQKEIAMWWNDDPSDTYTPPGHSYNLASIVLRSRDAGLITSAEVYARAGMAVADAFILCWKIKYKYCTERPSSFISEHIDPAWEPFWPDPPFPSFPSGHATQAGAVAAAMSGYFGDNITIVDDTHSERPKDRIRNVEYKSRRFTSFSQVAEETAMSRFYGGIHCRIDNVVGLAEGRKVGTHINSLHWDN